MQDSPRKATSGSTAPPVEEAGFTLRTYRATTRLAARAAPLILRHRERRGKEDPLRRGERLGLASKPRPEGHLCWIHAASVGETNAIIPLLSELRKIVPETRFLLTTGTLTSAKLAAERLPVDDIHQFAPLDAPQYVGRFLDHWRPELAILTESEIWPNTILDCYDRGIPLAIVNGRMSARSYRRWSQNKSLSQPLFNCMRLILAQNEDLVAKFRALGAHDVRLTGNIKIDAPQLPVKTEDRDALAAAIGARPVWAAASTHTGEDEVVIAAHAKLSQDHPDLLTIIAPRHPERGEAVAALASSAGLAVARRSLGEQPPADSGVYVLDTIGEMGLVYSLVPIAFIGGSLAGRGGQNPIEAIRFDTAIITGPDQSNFEDEYRALLAANGAAEVADEIELSETVSLLLRDDVERARLSRGAETALASLSGGLQRTVEALAPLLPGADKDYRRAS